jgi:hypothetical protein
MISHKRGLQRTRNLAAELIRYVSLTPLWWSIMPKRNVKKRSKRGPKYIETDDGWVVVFGIRFQGFITHGNRCPTCNSLVIYSDQHDAHLCAKCDNWPESACSAPTCSYCATRPERPSLSGLPAEKKSHITSVCRRPLTACAPTLIRLLASLDAQRYAVKILLDMYTYKCTVEI